MDKKKEAKKLLEAFREGHILKRELKEGLQCLTRESLEEYFTQ